MQESSSTKENNLEWIRTSLDSTGFDYSQEYRLGEKKNTIEIHVRNQHIGKPRNLFLFLMTLSMLPTSVDYKIDMSSDFYDNLGTRHNLNTANSLSIRATISLLLFAFYNNSNNNTQDSIQRLFLRQIIESYQELQNRNLTHHEFQSSLEPKEIRFLVPMEDAHSIDFLRWEDKQQSPNTTDVWIGWDDWE